MSYAPHWFPTLSALLFCTNLLASGTPSSVNLVLSTTPSIYGQPVILTAYISPSDATGRVTFLDGVSFLGTSILVSGQGTLVTTLLSTGTHTLRARYAGDSTYAGSLSAFASETTESLPASVLGPVTTYTASTTAAYLAAADFDRDGKTDLVVTSGAGIDILLGKGDGTFGPPATYGTSYSVAVATADFNGDGLVDLAVVNNTANTVSILLGNGDGTFQSPVDFATGLEPVSIVVADLNSDGVADLAVAYARTADGSSGGVSELFGNGGGAFQAAVNLSTPPGPSFIAAADLNNDGAADLVITDQGGYVRVFLGRGDGSFQDALLYGVYAYARAVAVEDLNGDGFADLIVAFEGAESAPSLPTQPQTYDVAVFLGTGDGTFGIPVYYACAGRPFGVTVADFNGDSKLDVAVADPFGGTASVLLGNGDGTLGPAAIYRVPQELAVTPVAADFNGDGVMDLAVSNLAGTQNLSILLGQPATPAQVFTDVPPSTYDFTAVNDLFALGITNGCGPSQFCPDQPIPRWQAAIFLVRAMFGGDNFMASATPYFADVPIGAPGFVWIQELYELGITGGCGMAISGVPLFCPNVIVTRDDAAILLTRERYGATTPFGWPATPYFADVPSGAFAFPWIQRLGEDNISAGCATALYCPSDEMTRGEMAILIVRAGFNLLLPATEPLIGATSPRTLTQGMSALFTIAGRNTHFVQGTTQLVFSTSSGLTVNSIQVTSPTTITFSLTASPTALVEPTSIYVQTGTEEAVLPNGIAVLPGSL